MAALAGLMVDIVRRNVGRWSAFAGLAPVGLLLLLSHQTQPPESVPGPVVLLVQPAVSPGDKQVSKSMYDRAVDLTRAGLDSLREEDKPPPDVVCWGETMLGFPIVGENLEEAVRTGMPVEVSLATISEISEVFRWPPEKALELKAHGDLVPMIIELLKVNERRVISEKLLGSGKDRILPPDCGFISGAVVWVSHEGEMRKENSVCAWSPDGRRTAVCSKLELVPGGETLYGLGSFKLVSDFMMKKFRYLPNFVAGEEVGVLDLPARPEQSGRSWRATGTVCYDNSFLHPYTDPLAKGEEVDLHVICSNEAWYLDSWEMDQMVCMSRMIAISTARPVVRATNSGVSCILDARGRELGRIQKDGVDRQVPGFLALEVPVPPQGAPVTPFCHFRGPLAWFFVLLAGVAAWGSRRSGGYQEGAWE